MRGWVRDGSGGLGAILAAPQLAIEAPRMPEYITRAVTVLIPYRGATPPAPTVEADPGGGDRPGRLRLAWPDGSADTLVWNEGLDFMLGATDAGTTDGALLYTRTAPDGKTDAAAVVDGTWCDGPPDPTFLGRATPPPPANE
ncbi:MAG: hypothetical protein ACOCX4_09040 [Planctomycetota bacterium]